MSTNSLVFVGARDGEFFQLSFGVNYPEKFGDLDIVGGSSYGTNNHKGNENVHGCHERLGIFLCARRHDLLRLGSLPLTQSSRELALIKFWDPIVRGLGSPSLRCGRKSERLFRGERSNVLI